MNAFLSALNSQLKAATGKTYLSEVELETEDLKICDKCGAPEDDHEKGWRCPVDFDPQHGNGHR